MSRPKNSGGRGRYAVLAWKSCANSTGTGSGRSRKTFCDPLRLRDRYLPCDEAAERMADQRCAFDPEGIEKGDEVGPHFGNRVAGFWTI